MSTNTTLNVVLGLSPTGLSCVKFCLCQGFPVVAMDSRENPPCKKEAYQLGIEIVTGGFSKELFDRATRLIISPGLSLQDPPIAEAIANGVPYGGDIELFAQHVSAPIIAITGSNGKSTTTSLVGEILKCAGTNVQVGGNIGIPALDLLEKPPADIYVLEISSFQLDTTFSLKAQSTTVLNVSQNHLNRYNNSLAEYTQSKTRIYENCHTAIVNRHEPSYISPLTHPAKIISFGLDSPSEGQYGLIETQEGLFFARGKELLFNTQEMKIKGRHNLANALAAMALAEGAGVLDINATREALRTFGGLRHRCQFIREKEGVKWYNDSKSTTVAATLAAVTGLGPELKGKIVLIAGGQGKGAEFSAFEKPFQKYVSHLILLGEDADKIAQGVNNAVPIHRVTSFQEAIEAADQHAKSGDIVLLSPACASFDMFKNFEYRGNEFIKIVEAL